MLVKEQVKGTDAAMDGELLLVAFSAQGPGMQQWHAPAAALRAAAEESGQDRRVDRRSFRLLLMRTHQYLDVFSVLHDVVHDVVHDVGG